MNREELNQHMKTYRVKINRDTPAGKAWNEYAKRTIGQNMVWDTKGNWYLPSEWPPDTDLQPNPGDG